MTATDASRPPSVNPECDSYRPKPGNRRQKAEHRSSRLRTVRLLPPRCLNLAGHSSPACCSRAYANAARRATTRCAIPCTPTAPDSEKNRRTPVDGRAEGPLSSASPLPCALTLAYTLRGRQRLAQSTTQSIGRWARRSAAPICEHGPGYQPAGLTRRSLRPNLHRVARCQHLTH